MDKISPIKERILFFIRNQHIKKTEFCKNTGISYANLKGKGLESEIGGIHLGKILSSYPFINAEWLITGNGPLTKERHLQKDLELEQKISNDTFSILWQRIDQLIIENNDLKREIAGIKNSTNSQESNK